MPCNNIGKPPRDNVHKKIYRSATRKVETAYALRFQAALKQIFINQPPQKESSKMLHLTEAEKAEMREAIKQADAIFALEGFEKTEQSKKIDEAVLAGRVSNHQVIDEMIAYVKEHKTTNGFIESREWQ